jgi:monoamine oxidase
MNPHTSEVLVLGAGIAGLAAAARLCAAGRHVTVLEARDRIGGRILTQRPQRDVVVELGAEFLHGVHPALKGELKKAGLKIRPVDLKSWCFSHGKLEQCDFFERVDSVLQHLPRFVNPDRSFSEFLEEVSREQNISADARRWVLGYIRGFDAADPSRIGTRSLVREMRAEEETGGDKPLRPVSGFGTLVENLRAGCSRAEIVLGAIVRRVEYGADFVSVIADCNGSQREFRAQYVVVTLPLGVLQLPVDHPAHVEFEPVLKSKSRAFACLAMGNVLRINLLFSEQFWSRRKDAAGRKLSKLGFLFSQQEFFPTWWTRPAGKLGLLTGWTPEPSALFLSQHRQPREYAIARALESLSQLLPVSRAELDSLLLDVHVHDWITDRYSMGAYSYVAAGGDGAQADLARPIDDKLFFAGEATETSGHHATVHGAFLTGLRAADEILGNKKRSLHFADSV